MAGLSPWIILPVSVIARLRDIKNCFFSWQQAEFLLSFLGLALVIVIIIRQACVPQNYCEAFIIP